MNGLHLTADLHGCPAALAPMTDAAALRALCLGAVARAGLHRVGELFHAFAPPAGEPPSPSGRGPGGVTGVVLLAESHLAVHTWPELGTVSLDVYVCNLGGDNSARAERLLALLLEAFEPGSVRRQTLQRGAAGAGTGAGTTGIHEARR